MQRKFPIFAKYYAEQINRFAHRLSVAPLGRSASGAAAAERFKRLLVASPAALVELAAKTYVAGLRAILFNAVSSRPKALARYCDLAVLAIEARLRLSNGRQPW